MSDIEFQKWMEDTIEAIASSPNLNKTNEVTKQD